MDTDFNDLEDATRKYCDCCVSLNKILDKERITEENYLEKQKEIRLNNWIKVTDGEITQSLFNNTLKNKCFQEEIDYKKSCTIRKQEQNRLNSLKEKLYTTKLKIKLT